MGFGGDSRQRDTRIELEQCKIPAKKNARAEARAE
jgi:hypothetical protein